MILKDVTRFPNSEEVLEFREIFVGSA